MCGRKDPGAASDSWVKYTVAGKLTCEQKPSVSERGSQDAIWGNSKLGNIVILSERPR